MTKLLVAAATFLFASTTFACPEEPCRTDAGSTAEQVKPAVAACDEQPCAIPTEDVVAEPNDQGKPDKVACDTNPCAVPGEDVVAEPVDGDKPDKFACISEGGCVIPSEGWLALAGSFRPLCEDEFCI